MKVKNLKNIVDALMEQGLGDCEIMADDTRKPLVCVETATQHNADDDGKNEIRMVFAYDSAAAIARLYTNITGQNTIGTTK